MRHKGHSVICKKKETEQVMVALGGYLISQVLLCCFLNASTVAATSVKENISAHIVTVLIMSLGMVSRKQKRAQIPTIDVGTLMRIQNSFQVYMVSKSLSHSSNAFTCHVFVIFILKRCLYNFLIIFFLMVTAILGRFF